MDELTGNGDGSPGEYVSDEGSIGTGGKGEDKIGTGGEERISSSNTAGELGWLFSRNLSLGFDLSRPNESANMSGELSELLCAN